VEIEAGGERDFSLLTESQIYGRLTEIFREAFLRDDLWLSASITARDIDGWDSLKQIMILVSVEQRFNVKFSTREMDNLHCVGDLVTLIAAKIG
jgi:acyl carrier protein